MQNKTTLGVQKVRPSQKHQLATLVFIYICVLLKMLYRKRVKLSERKVSQFL